MFIVEEANNLGASKAGHTPDDDNADLIPPVADISTHCFLILGGGWDILMNEVDKPYLQRDVAVLDVTFHIFLLFTCYTSHV